MNVAKRRISLVVILALLLLTQSAFGQSSANPSGNAQAQSAASSLASLPEADIIIYASPARILNDVAPRLIPAADVSNMRATFADFKRAVGVDPATIDYFAIAIRFQKPSADLNFVPPELVAVSGGDFSADSLVTLAGLYLQDKARTEKYGSKTLTILKIDPIAQEAAKNPLLKSFAELAVVALSANTMAFGSVSYVKSAVDASEGNGRINSAAISSLLRDPNAIVSAAGSPLTAFAKSFGMLGTQTTPRDPRCDTRFGDFYSAITTDGKNFSLRGALNADNPDTATILNGLLSGLFQQATNYVPEKEAQAVLKNIRLSARESEVIVEADVPEATLATYIQNEMKPKKNDAPQTKTQAKPKRRTRRR